MAYCGRYGKVMLAVAAALQLARCWCSQAWHLVVCFSHADYCFGFSWVAWVVRIVGWVCTNAGIFAACQYLLSVEPTVRWLYFSFCTDGLILYRWVPWSGYVFVFFWSYRALRFRCPIAKRSGHDAEGMEAILLAE